MLRRKQEAPAVEPAEVETPEPAERPVPFWKKEISLKRKPKPLRAEEAAAEEAPAPAEDEPAAERVPFWKKELSFGRKPKDEPAVEAEASEEEEEESWNRDLIFRGVAPEPEPQPEPAAEPEPLPEPVFFDPVPAVEPEPEAEQEPEPEAPAVEHAWASPEISPSVSSAYGWLTEDLEAADLASTSWAGTAPPVPIVREAPRSEIVAEPAAAPAPEEEAEAAPAPARDVEVEEAEPPAPPEAEHDEEEPEPEPEHVDEPERKPSLLKRDLSFRRRRPRAEPEPEPEVVADAHEAEDEPEPEPKGRRRRDRSFRRRATDVPPEADEQAQPKQRRRARGGGRRQKKLVGLKVGASQLAAARVHNNGSAQLVQLARQELEPGVVVGGELRDPEALAQALKEFFKKHKLPKRGVRLGIANNRIGVRSFDLAGIDDPKQLANAIRFRAQEALPIPIEEAVLDYRVLAETNDDEGATSRRILLVVAYRDLVDRYVDACRKAGIRLAGIDLEAFALLRALAAPPEAAWEAEAATVAVAIGHERSTFAVSDGRVCEFTRVLEWGGSSLNVAIARALDLAPSEAEPIKRALSLAAETDVEGLDAEQVGRAREAMLRQVQTFARELVSSLQFYQGQPGSLGIAEITVTGGTAHLPGLAAELERLIGVRVRVADPLARVRVGKKVAHEEQIGSLAVAIGLGIDD